MPTTESLLLAQWNFIEELLSEREQAIDRFSPPLSVCQICWGVGWDERLPSDVPTEHDFCVSSRGFCIADVWYTPCQNCNPGGIAPGEIGKE